jgi:hypothetical protein
MQDSTLIAEFMGYRVFNKGTKCYSPKYNDGTIAPMQFHTSWDWLMPVLKKINLQLHPDTYGMWRMINTPTEYTIEEVHAQAVQFIKRYSNE